VYGLGFIITREMVEDDLYGQISKKKASALARSARHTKEIILANIYNRAFNSSYTGGDGKELLATDHPNITGGTYSNELTTAANLSEAALEQACIDIRKYTDDRGLRIAVMPKKLILPVDLEFEAHRILRSDGRVGTALNDPNALKDMGKFGSVVLNNYLTSTTAWFIRTDVEDGMKYFQRRGMEFTTDNDWSTENAMFKVTERYSGGWSDPKGLFGSPGV
jgi:phage major head subunit gpT-like protein